MTKRQGIGLIAVAVGIAISITANISVAFDASWFREKVMNLFSRSFEN